MPAFGDAPSSGQTPISHLLLAGTQAGRRWEFIWVSRESPVSSVLWPVRPNNSFNFPGMDHSKEVSQRQHWPAEGVFPSGTCQAPWKMLGMSPRAGAGVCGLCWGGSYVGCEWGSAWWPCGPHKAAFKSQSPPPGLLASPTKCPQYSGNLWWLWDTCEVGQGWWPSWLAALPVLSFEPGLLLLYPSATQPGRRGRAASRGCSLFYH